MNFREISVINWPKESSFVSRHIAACANPVRTQRWQALRDIAMKIGIAPRAARVVHAHWFVLENYGRGPCATLDLAADRFRRCERDFPERDANIRMQFARDVSLFGIETRSTPVSLAASRRGFTFYVARSIWQRRFCAL